MKGFIKLIIVIAVLGGIWFAWEQWKGNEAIQVDYQTEPLEKGDLMITIEATGVTEPDELVDVGAQVSGIIMEFGKDLNGKVVDYSSPVKAGQMLAEIDKLPVQLDVQRAEASKAQANCRNRPLQGGHPAGQSQTPAGQTGPGTRGKAGAWGCPVQIQLRPVYCG